MPVISASQLTLYHNQCKRRWGFRYLEGIKEESTQGQCVGTLCHWYLERHLAEGRRGITSPSRDVWDTAKIQAPRVAAIMEKVLPVVGHTAWPEWEFRVDLPDTDIPLVGKVDWIQSIDRDAGGNAVARGTCLEVGDLKTTKSFGYMRNVVELMDDWQGKVYPVAALQLGPWERLKCRWVYAKTAKDRDSGSFPEPRVVEWWNNREQIERKKQAVLDGCAPLVQLYKEQPEVMSLEGNEDACGLYSGCPFRDKCTASRVSQSGSGESKVTNEQVAANTQEILAFLQGRAEKMPEPAAAQPKVLIEARASAKAEPGTDDLRSEVEALAAQAAVTQAPSSALSPPIPPAAVSAEDGATIPARRGRGRPKGSKSAKKAEPAAPAQPPEVVANPAPALPIEIPDAAPTVSVAYAAKVSNTLYVNCAPARTAVPWVFEIPQFQQAASQVEKTAGVPWELVKYNRGSALLASEFAKLLPTVEISALRCSTSMKSCQALVDLLVAAWADEVVTAAT